MKKDNRVKSISKKKVRYRKYRKNLMISEELLGFGFHDNEGRIKERN
ncbi:MAG: hypothetical protein JW891_02690 [Candidatus Lokiarchaeota archaeon]|nr:hypothetical protein [Candidatus Lokiarchaeota archaeon]